MSARRGKRRLAFSNRIDMKGKLTDREPFQTERHEHSTGPLRKYYATNMFVVAPLQCGLLPFDLARVRRS